jgi:hypothetical protein
MHDRRHDDETRDRMDALEEHWRTAAKWLARQIRRIWIGFSIVALALLFGVVYTYHLNGDIEDSRRNVCEAVNVQHDKTIREVNRRIARAYARADPQRQKELLASRAFTLALIETLAPKKDCENLDPAHP